MTDHWLIYLLWVIPGSAIGGLARYHLSGSLSVRYERFPVGTLVVNVSGAFLIGMLAFFPWQQAGVSAGLEQNLRLFLIYGFLGGFTTVSAFSLQTLDLLHEGEMRKAGLNVLLSVCLTLAAVAAGAALAVAVAR